MRPRYLPRLVADGSEILFQSPVTENREIYVMDADGSAQKRLTNDPDRDTFPVWSPVRE